MPSQSWESTCFIKHVDLDQELKNVEIVWQMTTSIAVEDVRRELKILQALSGHDNLLQFYDAFEDNDNVYIVME